MKRFLRFSLLIAMFLATRIGNAQDPNFFIFLCFGQSNMEGQGGIETQDRTVDERFRLFQSMDCPNLGRTKAEWIPAIPPTCRCWNGLSPADYFGRTLVENLPEHIRVGVINVSVGGCRIELFDKDIYENYTNTYSDAWFQDIITAYGGNPYAYMLNLAKQAQKSGVIKGILLHQGETNTGDSQWPTKVKKIYSDLMTDLSLDPTKVPLLAGELVHEDQGGLCASMNSIIGKLPATLPNSYVISSSGCTDKTDNIHFDAAGYRTLGTRYGEKMLTLLEYDEALGLSSEEEQGDYFLSQNFPNPAGGETSIEFKIPAQMDVLITLHDTLGREMSVIADGRFSRGVHIVEPKLSGLSKGIYFYTMKAGEFTLTRKLVVE